MTTQQPAYIDICVNLFSERFPDPEAVLARAAQNGIRCISVGCDMEGDRWNARFVRGRQDVYGTAGIHPHDAKDMQEGDIEELEEMFRSTPRLLAVGECGLDYERMYSPREKQLQCFEAQIALAEKLEKPLLLHERGAAEDMYSIMKAHPAAAQRAVAHCFTGTAETVQEYLDLGMHIGITGWVCDDRRNQDLLAALPYIPLERMMVETDAPFLKPRKVRGTHNIPNNIVWVVRRIAQERGIPEEEVRTAVLRTTTRFFGIPVQEIL